jgi:hypothetical protein
MCDISILTPFAKNIYDCIDNGIRNISLQHIISREGIGD